MALHRLVELLPLVHLILHKKKIRGGRDIFKILCELRAGALKEPAVLNDKKPPLRKERQRLRLVDQLVHRNVFPLVAVQIYSILRGDERRLQTVLILLFQIVLLPEEKINIFEIVIFQILYQIFHVIPILFLPVCAL